MGGSDRKTTHCFNIAGHITCIYISMSYRKIFFKPTYMQLNQLWIYLYEFCTAKRRISQILYVFCLPVIKLAGTHLRNCNVIYVLKNIQLSSLFHYSPEHVNSCYWPSYGCKVVN